jgi:hypothetical protein
MSSLNSTNSLFCRSGIQGPLCIVSRETLSVTCLGKSSNFSRSASGAVGGEENSAIARISDYRKEPLCFFLGEIINIFVQGNSINQGRLC